jgi:hypothetical protein
MSIDYMRGAREEEMPGHPRHFRLYLFESVAD